MKKKIAILTEEVKILGPTVHKVGELKWQGVDKCLDGCIS